MLVSRALINNQNVVINYSSEERQERLSIDFLGVSDDFLFSLSPFLNGHLPNSTHPIVLLEASVLWESDNDNHPIFDAIKSTDDISIQPTHSIYYNSSFSYNCSIAGTIDISSLEQVLELNKILGYLGLHSHSPYLMLSSYEGFLDVVNFNSDRVQLSEEGEIYFPFRLTFCTFCKVNTERLNPYHLSSFRELLDTFVEKTYQNLQMYNIHIDKTILRRMDHLETELFILKAIIFVTSFPVLLLAILLVVHSFSVVEPRKRKNVKELKLRGASSEQLGFIFSLEVIVETIIALGGGILAGYLLSSVIVHSSGFLAFEASQCELNVSSSTIISICLSSLLIFFDLNIIHTIALSRENELTVVNQTEKEELKWQKNALFGAFIIGGAGVWYSITFLETKFPPALFFSHEKSTIMFGAFFLAIGLIILITKIIPWLLSFASSFLWRRFRSPVILISHSLLQRKSSVSRLITIISFSLLLISISSLIPYSLDKYTVERKYYHTGADIALTGFNLTDQTLIHKLNNFTEFEWTSTLQFYNYETTTALGILVINSSSFSQAAFWKSSYGGEYTLDSLLQSCSSGNILIQESDLSFIAKSLNESWRISCKQIHENGSISTLEEYITLGLTYKIWPSFIEKYQINRRYDTSLLLRLVIDFSLYYDHFDLFSALSYNSNPFEDGKILVKLNNYNEISQVISKLETVFYGTGISIIDALNEPEDIDTDSPLAFEDYIFILMSTFNSNFVLFLLSLILVVLLFNFFVLSDRKSELGLYKVLGMKNKQLFWLIFLEILLIMLTGMIIGNILGMGLAYLFFFFYKGGGAPPFEMRIPSSILLLINGGIIVVSLITVVITLYVLNRQEIGQILRNE
jgi:ABC-type antimicrobial peptide transport system permease subunit